MISTRVHTGILLAVVTGVLFGVWPSQSWAASALLEKFDHDLHMERVFKPLATPCSQCHNFRVDKDTKTVLLEEASQKSPFRVSFKQMCHECHQSAESRYQGAVKTCFTCHASNADLKAILPANHKSVAWKGSHALESRVAGGECLNCHVTSQCVKCHSQRNDVRMRNHARNFRYTHSVQARLEPHRCDSCHTRSFCVECHVGRR